MTSRLGSTMDEIRRIAAETLRTMMQPPQIPKPRMCRAQGCTNEAHINDFCRACDDRQLGDSE